MSWYMEWDLAVQVPIGLPSYSNKRKLDSELWFFLFLPLSQADILQHTQWTSA